VIVMKKDSNNKATVRKSASPSVPIGDPRPAQQQKQRVEPAVTTSNWSVRYIDSRLKQFYCR